MGESFPSRSTPMSIREPAAGREPGARFLNEGPSGGDLLGGALPRQTFARVVVGDRPKRLKPGEGRQRAVRQAPDLFEMLLEERHDVPMALRLEAFGQEERPRVMERGVVRAAHGIVE